MRYLMFFASALAVVCARAANVVIDDTAVTSDITVESGAELEIRGSGLSAASARTVTLAGNNTVRFYTTATVAAKLVAAKLTLQSDADATGTFSGGASLTGAVTMATGDIRFATKNVSCAKALTIQGGHLTVTGCTWTATGTKSNGYLLMDSAAQVEDACLELATGGTYKIQNTASDCYCHIGRNAFESKILINGGAFLGGYDAFYLNKNNGAGNVVIEIRNGGVFQTCRPGFDAESTQGTSKVILGENGRILCKKPGTWTKNWLVRDAGDLTFSVEGHAILDVSDCDAAMRDAQSATSGNRVRWTCTENGLLTVRGRSDGSTSLALRNVDSGMKIVFAPYVGTLVLMNPTDAMTLGFSATGASKVVSSNANCELTLDPILTGSTAVRSASDLAPGTEGFKSVSFRDVTVDAASTFSYFSRRFMDDFAGSLTLKSGSLIFDTDPGAKFTREEGTSVYFQDVEPYVMSNTSQVVSTDSGWRDPSGSTGGWHPGALGVIETMANNGFITGRHIAYGLRVIGSGSHYWDSNDGRFEIGSGGLVFTKSDVAWGPSSGSYVPRIVLTENQVWTNAAASGTSYVQFGFSYATPKYYKAYMTAADGVTDWRLAGRLETWLYSPSNDLRNVTVTIEGSARLRLVSNIDARLNAAKLVLDGADMAFGQAMPRSDGFGTPSASVAAIDAFHLAPEVELRNGGTLTVSKAVIPFAVPTLAAHGTGNRIAGETIQITQAVTAVSVPLAGDRLDIESKIVRGGDGTFNVSGLGTLSLTSGFASDFNFSDGGTLVLAADGSLSGTVTGVGKLVVNTTGSVYLPQGALADYAGDTIAVSSGTLVCADVAAIPSGVRIETTGTGALLLGDPTGFDPETRMTGTKNLVSSGALIVTDDPRENETLTVGSGETLQVFGSGLKASSKVILQKGASIGFCRPATIEAPIVATDGVSVVSHAGAVGRLKGTYTGVASAATDVNMDISGDGTVDFAGGVDLGANVRLRVNGGHVVVSSGKLKVLSSIRMLAGDLTFTNSTYNVAVTSGDTRYVLGLADSAQWGDATITFLKGSSWNMDNNHYAYIGYNDGVESRLVLDGGTWTCSTYDPFMICASSRGNGVFEFKSGTFYSNRRIQAGNGGNARFIWSGGTFCGYGNTYGYRYNYLCSGTFAECALAGDCTLDLRYFKMSVVSNFLGSAGRMTVRPGARLTIKSDDSKVGYCSHAVLNGLQGDELTLKLVGSAKNGPVTVDLPDYTDPVRIAWTVGGAGTVNAVGTSPALLASYVVPNGQTYSQNDPPADWYAGFSSVTLQNLTFEAGSTYLFPLADSVITPLELPGTLTLPAAMNFAVDSATKVRPAKIQGATLVNPALGLVGEDCTWTCTGGISKHWSRVYAEDGLLKFSYEPAASIIFLR